MNQKSFALVLSHQKTKERGENMEDLLDIMSITFLTVYLEAMRKY